MKKLFSETEFKNAKSRTKLPLECISCHKTFFHAKSSICAKIKGSYRKTGDFCSTKCQLNFQHPPIIVKCDQCNKLFKKISSQIKKTKHNFCCHSCAAKYRCAHKTKGTRVSKMEVYIQDKLKILYPQPDYFHFNRTNTINAELDIYIPSLKLAFELNGIFHYEPIYGDKKLSSMKTNDQRKMQACLEQKISLCIIDISHVTYFKPSKAEKFLKIITDIIEKKISDQ